MTEAANVRQEFGRNLRAERSRRGWTQAELADKAGISPTYISRLERGEQSVSLPAAMSLAETLDVKLAELTGETA